VELRSPRKAAAAPVGVDLSIITPCIQNALVPANVHIGSGHRFQELAEHAPEDVNGPGQRRHQVREIPQSARTW
jgi:hypothetical protein